MSLIGHSVPPIFRRGPAPLVRLMVFVAIALTMLVADLKFRYLEVMRQSLSVILYPVEMAAGPPASRKDERPPTTTLRRETPLNCIVRNSCNCGRTPMVRITSAAQRTAYPMILLGIDAGSMQR